MPPLRNWKWEFGGKLPSFPVRARLLVLGITDLCGERMVKERFLIIRSQEMCIPYVCCSPACHLHYQMCIMPLAASCTGLSL